MKPNTRARLFVALILIATAVYARHASSTAEKIPGEGTGQHQAPNEQNDPQQPVTLDNSQANKVTPSTNHPGDNQGKDVKNPRPKTTWGEGIIATCTVALFILAIVTGGIMYAQTKQTDKIIAHMRQELRPWVSIVKPRIEYWEHQGWWFICGLRNHGRIPASIVNYEFGGTLEVCSTETPGHVRSDVAESPRAHENLRQVIAPGSKGYQMQGFQMPDNVTKIQAFFDGDIDFACAFRVKYIATDGDDYSTGGMYSFRRRGSEWVPIIIGGPEDNYMK